MSHEKRNKHGHLCPSCICFTYKRKYVHCLFCAPQGSWFGLKLRLIGHKKASRGGREARSAQLRSGLAYLSQSFFVRFVFFFSFRYRFQFHAVIDLL